MKNSIKVDVDKFFVGGFLLCLITLPLFSIFWQDSIPLTSIKLNWIGYSILVVSIMLTISFRKRIPQQTFILTIFILVYSIIALLRTSDIGTPIRLYVSILPFTFLDHFHKNNISYKWFWISYSIIICLPLYFSYRQYQGTYPYFEFDTINGENVGRISGGYNKPMNLICFLFPIFLAGLYLVMVKHKKVIGYIIILLICSFLWVIGHRTSFISFLIVFVASFFSAFSTKIIYTYFKYLLNFSLGIAFFVALFLIENYYGLLEGLRGRIAMWLAHAENFFNSGFINILFGKQEILLDYDKYSPHLVTRLIGTLEEAHNNTFRTIIYFGVVGYLFYCLLFRWMVMKTYHSSTNYRIRFLRLTCFIFLVLFGITNEPAYYSSLFWPVMLGIFPIFNDEKELNTFLK